MSKNSRKILITVALVCAAIGVVGLMTGTLSLKGLLFAAAAGGTIIFLASLRPAPGDRITLQLFVLVGILGLVIPFLGSLLGVPMAEPTVENMFVAALGLPERPADQAFNLAVIAVVSFSLLRGAVKAKAEEEKA